MKPNRLRAKKYGLGHIVYGLSGLAGLGVCISVYHLLLFLFDGEETAYLIGLLCLFPVFGCLFVFDLRLTDRQMARDLEAAKDSIRRPLRNAVFGNQEPMDFDPHFPTVSPNGKLVHAVDPRRRATRYIVCHWIDADGRLWDDAGPFEGIVTKISQATLPAKRRWFGLLPARNATGNIELAITILEDGKETTARFHFRPDDHSVDGWRRTFEQWMYEDQQGARNPVDLSSSLRHP